MILDRGLQRRQAAWRRILSLGSDVQSIITRHDPARWTRTLAYRRKADLPYDPSKVPAGASLLLDASVYIDQLKGQLPSPIVSLIASRTILHSASALAEIAVAIGILDPADSRTRDTLIPIIEMLARIHPSRIIVPNYEIWLEAAIVAGILARTQAIPKQDRRKFLADAQLFLQAADSEAIMVSRNARDFDLLLQLKPQVHVLLYEKSD